MPSATTRLLLKLLILQTRMDVSSTTGSSALLENKLLKHSPLFNLATNNVQQFLQEFIYSFGNGSGGNYKKSIFI